MPFTYEQKIEWEVRQGIVLPKDTKPVLHQYKDPLTPIRGGYGYIGTIAYNEEGTHTQCHLCGYFFKGLSQHIKRRHDMTSRDYKRRFSIMQKTSLLAPKAPNRVRTDTTVPALSKADRIAVLSAYWGINKKRPETMEEKNLKGRCPEQLLYKVLKLAEDLGKVPTRREFIVKYRDGGDLASIYRTFGSWNGIIKELGLKPNKERLYARNHQS